MTKKSNLEQLVEAGVLDPANMGDEAKKIVNNEMTAEEVKHLISAHKRFPNNPPYKPDARGAGF